MAIPLDARLGFTPNRPQFPTLGSAIGAERRCLHCLLKTKNGNNMKSNNTLRRFGLLTLSLFASAIASATTYNVSSIAALQSAINSAVAGDIIILADGTYLNNTITVGTSNITVKSATPGGVYLNGTNAITINGSYVTFSGFQFTSGSITGIAIVVNGSHNLLTQLNFDGYSAKKYIDIKAPSQYNEIVYCNFRNKPTSAPSGNLVHVGADPSAIGYHKIRYSSFQDLPGLGADFGNEPIRLSNGAESTYIARTVVEFCYFNNTGGGDSEAISVKCRENVLRFNTFTNNQNAMMVFRMGDNNIAYGNFFIGAGGIRVKEANNIFCYNNYFENSGVGGTMNAVSYIFVSPNLKNINFVHNTFVECGLIDLASGATNNTWANNIFKKTSGDIFMGSPSGIAWAGNIYQGTLGISIPSGMTNADPQLTLNSDGYYGLSSTSPAIDAASASYPAILDIANVDDDPTLAFDISGQARPATVILKDVGCDEYTTGSTTNRPLLLSDVGPVYLGGPGSGPTAPSITTQPQSQTVNIGASVTFSVVATGTGPLSYQWKKNTVDIGGATSDSYTISSVQPTDAGSYTVVVTNSVGSVTSSAATLTVNSLPAPWETADIGAVGIAGSANESAGNFTVTGSGTGITGSSDQFRYVYQTMSGDGSITAKINSHSGTTTSSHAGVMIRETTATGSMFAAVVHRGSGGKNMYAIRRTSTGGSTASTSSTSQTPPNCWVKITRTGNSLTMQRSTNGTSWTTINTSTITMATNITVGLIVTSGNNSILDTDVFTDVTVVP